MGEILGGVNGRRGDVHVRRGHAEEIAAGFRASQGVVVGHPHRAWPNGPCRAKMDCRDKPGNDGGGEKGQGQQLGMGCVLPPAPLRRREYPSPWNFSGR